MKISPPADFAPILEAQLAPPLREPLRQAASVAARAGVACYLVGGPVRDLLLERPVDDLDIVVEGDAMGIAEEFAALAGGSVTRHGAFGTANVLLPSAAGAPSVDFVTARSERYPEPAALPVVEPATIADDLRRRDFTINTLAIRLGVSAPSTLLDLCDGLPDLERGLVRVLHDRSFVDDPTRILRAARFAARLDFAIEERTAGLIRAAADDGLIERTSPVRILHELWLAFREPSPARVLRLLHELGALAHVIPGLTMDARLAGLLDAARRQERPEDERRLVMLALLAWSLDTEAREALAQRPGFSAVERRIIANTGAIRRIVETLAHDSPSLSAADRLLRPLHAAELALAELVAEGAARRIIEQHRDAIHALAPLLTGDDLRALGIPPGPRYRQLLDGLRSAQIDGEIQTRADAEVWVRAMMRDA